MTIDELLQTSGVVTRAAVLPARAKAEGVYLHAGQTFSAAHACELTTILGSCIAVCITDPVAGIGGANHYMLPFDVYAGQGGPRFATFAIPHLVADLISLGARRSRMVAKVFGGACVLREFQRSGNDLGLRNAEAAQRLLAAESIPIVHSDVGGTHGRKLVYRTADGSFQLKTISS